MPMASRFVMQYECPSTQTYAAARGWYAVKAACVLGSRGRGQAVGVRAGSDAALTVE